MHVNKYLFFLVHTFEALLHKIIRKYILSGGWCIVKHSKETKCDLHEYLSCILTTSAFYWMFTSQFVVFQHSLWTLTKCEYLLKRHLSWGSNKPHFGYQKEIFFENRLRITSDNFVFLVKVNRWICGGTTDENSEPESKLTKDKKWKVFLKKVPLILFFGIWRVLLIDFQIKS